MLSALDARIRAALPGRHEHPELERFYQLIRSYPERGGKRLRGLVLLLSTAAHGADWRDGLEAAAALELFQNWVLIHDDIEDDSDERRGEPALHRLVGMPIALNVGDALHVIMWAHLHRFASAHACGATIVDEFAWMIQRTAEGQHLDLSWIAAGRFDISEEDYLQMAWRKTACYTAICPLRLGALCANLQPDPRLEEAGSLLGTAFQIRDDVLNLIPTAGEGPSYGKEFAGDLYEAKRTLILAHLFAHADEAEQDELRERLARARHERRDEDVAFVLACIERHGSLEHAQRVADERAREGLDKLRAVLRELPGQAYGDELLRLLESFTRRRH
jgi:geranylgeranyl diphosphate synthase type II